MEKRTDRKEDDMQRREQAEKRKICRAMDKGTGRKEEDMQNNGEETGRKEDDAEQWRRKQANKNDMQKNEEVKRLKGGQ
jgi:hypothetical protein